MHQVIGVAGVAGALVSRGSSTYGTSQAGGAEWVVLLPVPDQVAEWMYQGFMPRDGRKA